MNAIKPKRMNGKRNDLRMSNDSCKMYATFVIRISHSLPISNEMSMIKFVPSPHLKGLIMDVMG